MNFQRFPAVIPARLYVVIPTRFYVVIPTRFYVVIPAKAGIQSRRFQMPWMPVSTGMTANLDSNDLNRVQIFSS